MKRFAFLALTLAGVCWGLGFPLGKLALAGDRRGARRAAALRGGRAGRVAVRPGPARGAGLFRSPRVLLAGALYGVAFVVQFEGLAHVSVTLAALLVGAMPALVAVWSRLAGRARSARAYRAGVAAATVGAVLIAGRPDGAGLAARRRPVAILAADLPGLAPGLARRAEPRFRRWPCRR